MQFTATTENEPVAEGQENEPGTEEAMAQGQGNVTLTTTEVMKAVSRIALVNGYYVINEFLHCRLKHLDSWMMLPLSSFHATRLTLATASSVL